MKAANDTEQMPIPLDALDASSAAPTRARRWPYLIGLSHQRRSAALSLMTRPARRGGGHRLSERS